jgi:hypothetical protein
MAVGALTMQKAARLRSPLVIAISGIRGQHDNCRREGEQEHKSRSKMPSRIAGVFSLRLH